MVWYEDHYHHSMRNPSAGVIKHYPSSAVPGLRCYPWADMYGNLHSRAFWITSTILVRERRNFGCGTQLRSTPLSVHRRGSGWCRHVALQWNDHREHLPTTMHLWVWRAGWSGDDLPERWEFLLLPIPMSTDKLWQAFRHVPFQWGGVQRFLSGFELWPIVLSAVWDRLADARRCREHGVQQHSCAQCRIWVWWRARCQLHSTHVHWKDLHCSSPKHSRCDSWLWEQDHLRDLHGGCRRGFHKQRSGKPPVWHWWWVQGHVPCHHAGGLPHSYLWSGSCQHMCWQDHWGRVLGLLSCRIYWKPTGEMSKRVAIFVAPES